MLKQRKDWETRTLTQVEIGFGIGGVYRSKVEESRVPILTKNDVELLLLMSLTFLEGLQLAMV